jgi:hypothetical protein
MPPNLHGLKGPELFGGVYMSRDLLAAWRAGAPDRIRWIVRNNQGIPDWAREGEVPAVGNSVQDHERRGADRRGVAGVRDGDAALLRRRSGTSGCSCRARRARSKRVRLFTEFVSRRLAAYVPLLAGLSYCRD